MINDEEIIETTKNVAQSLDMTFKYRKGDKNLRYVAEFDALVGNPVIPLVYLIQKARERGITLNSQEQFKAVHHKVWHEGMHGVIYREIGSPFPSRYIPEDYWLYNEEAKRFGRQQYEGLTINLFIDAKEVKLSLLERVSKHKQINKEITPLIALLLFSSKKDSLETIKPYWVKIKHLCASVSSISQINSIAQKIKEVLYTHGVNTE